ncbi:hypothetical protein NEMBOFW57_008325 [Staphylotrichum longicolle]|uniref:Protein kinase domain-containing protein n=1 Tax=Staphylotrichum longicolle TaxID=669026 RepID=A0AAD4EUX4_9PEZI|nr:hypothetical protein NEMBOFW57_008325 [Staphylotrichum longicolle]
MSLKSNTVSAPLPHHPDVLTAPASFSGLRFSTINSIALVGFGNAFPEPNPPADPARLSHLHLPPPPPPEVLFGSQYTRKSDVWQLACMLYKIHSTWLFPFGDLEMTSYERLVEDMTRYLGPSPESWKGNYDWERYGTVAAPPKVEDRHLEECCDPSQPTQSLKSVFANLLYSHITGREEVAELLEEMLVWEPEKRPTMGPQPDDK